MQDTYFADQSRAPRSSPPEIVQWPPPSGWKKINVDATFDEVNLTGAGTILFNDDGQVEDKGMQKWKFGEVLQGESNAILLGLKLSFMDYH